MEQSFDIERVSAASVASAAPANEHEKIRKIVSLLSRALVLTLSLLKDMVVVAGVAGDTKGINRIENVDPMVLEDGQREPGTLEQGSVGLGQTRVFNRNRWIFGSHA